MLSSEYQPNVNGCDVSDRRMLNMNDHSIKCSGMKNRKNNNL